VRNVSLDERRHDTISGHDTDKLGLFTPAAEARRPLVPFFMLGEVCAVRTGWLVGVFLLELSFARVQGWDWVRAC
jgi:hypothetical protein